MPNSNWLIIFNIKKSVLAEERNWVTKLYMVYKIIMSTWKTLFEHERVENTMCSGVF